MRPLLAIVIALTLVAVAAAVGLFAGENRSGGEVSGPSPAVTVAGPTKATVAAQPRAGRVLALADAIRELDLIKPARTKRAEDFSLNTPGSGKFRLFEFFRSLH